MLCNQLSAESLSSDCLDCYQLSAASCQSVSVSDKTSTSSVMGFDQEARSVRVSAGLCTCVAGKLGPVADCVVTGSRRAFQLTCHARKSCYTFHALRPKGRQL